MKQILITIALFVITLTAACSTGSNPQNSLNSANHGNNKNNVGENNPNSQNNGTNENSGLTAQNNANSQNNGNNSNNSNSANNSNNATNQNNVTNAEFTRPFSFSGSGAATGRITQYEISENVGTVAIDETVYPAAVYERQPFGEYVLYQTLVAAQDKWWVAWFYCRGDVMEGIYSEGTENAPLVWQPFQRTNCTTAQTSTINTATLPNPALQLTPKTSNYAVAGDDVTIGADGTGTTSVNGTDYTVTVFEHVDCTEECGSPGWYELHAILESQTQTCFGIYYLDDNPVQLAYVRCLPGFDNPIGNFTFNGSSWSD